MSCNTCSAELIAWHNMMLHLLLSVCCSSAKGQPPLDHVFVRIERFGRLAGSVWCCLVAECFVVLMALWTRMLGYAVARIRMLGILALVTNCGTKVMRAESALRQRERESERES